MTGAVYSSAVVGRIRVLEAIGSGWRLLLTRPGLVAIWTLAGTAALLPIFWAMPVLLGRSVGLTTAVVVAAVIDVAIVNLVLQSAAIRSVRAPEDRAFAYLRLGAAEWNLLLVGRGEKPRAGLFVLALPIPAILGGTAAWLGVHPPWPVFLLLGAGFLLGLAYVGLRLSLAATAAQAGLPHPLKTAWTLSRGHLWPIAWVQLGALLSFLSLAIPLSLLVLLGITTVGGGPVAAPMVAAGGLSLGGALYHTLCTRPSATVWQMLAGDRLNRDFLAAVTDRAG